MKQVEIGEVYRHFKGKYVYIENIGLDSETTERVVIYRHIFDGKESPIWTRKEKMFLEEIPDRSDNITGQKHRFELCEGLKK